MSAPPREPRLTRECAAVFVAGLALYLATSSRNLALAHDSIYYINSIDAGADLFHPHHLLYAALAHLWLVTWKAVVPSADSIFAVSSLNSLFGAMSLCLVYAILRRRFPLSATQAASGTALAGLAFGLWFYSTCIEVYVIPLFFLLLALFLLARGPLTAGRMGAVGAAHGLAILFHQSNVLFLPVALYALARDRRGTPASWVLPGAAYGAALVALVGIPYVAVMLAVGVHTPGVALDWLTSYARRGEYWHPLSLQTVFQAAAGAWRATVGSHFAFALPALRAWVARVFPEQMMADEAYLVHGLDPRLAAACVALSAALAAGILVALVGRAIRWRETARVAGRPLELLALWIVVYAAFFFFWVPYNPEFWIPQVTAFWILFCVLWFLPREKGPKAARLQTAVPILAGALLLAVNLVGTIFWTRSPSYDFYYVKIRPLGALARPGDLVVLGRAWILEGYVHRYSTAEILGLRETHDRVGRGAGLADSVARAVESARAGGHRVFVSEEAIELEPPVAEALGADATPLRDLWESYRAKWEVIPAGAVRFRRIDPRSPDS